MQQNLIASLVASACIAPAAMAADTWTGFNAGVDVGYARHTTELTDIDNAMGSRGTLERTDDGALIGVDVGYDRQFDSLVLGAVLDWSWSSIDYTQDYGNQPQPDWTIRNSLEWMASLRVRAGLAVEKTLLFISAGPALASVEHEIRPVNGTSADENWTMNDTVVGLMLGVGLEQQVAQRVSVRGELISALFDETSDSDDETPPGSVRAKDKVIALRLGAHYRF